MMLTIPTAYDVPAPNAVPALAKMVMRTCSLILNGPGFSEKVRSPNPGIRNLVVGSTFARNRPTGRAATWTVIWVMTSGSVRYAKNWLRKERVQHERMPSNHIRKVHTGREGSSVIGTVRRTSSIGDSSASRSVKCFSGSAAIVRVLSSN